MNYPIFVIIPVYNAEKFLEIAVRSVLDQPYANTRLILVNDGSSDSSGEICNRLSDADARICVVHQENGGVAKARNTGLDLVLSKCESNCDDVYVAFLDADDFWKKNMKWTVEGQDGADIIAFSSVNSNAKGNRYKTIIKFEKSTFLGDGANIQWINIGHFGGLLYRATFLQKNKLRFMEGVTHNEDVIFWRQAIFASRKVVFSPEVLYVYRINNDSVMHRSSIDYVSSLHIPKAWNRAVDWVFLLPDSTDIQKKRWTIACHISIGIHLLESAKVLAEYGYSAEEISAIIRDSSLGEYLEKLPVEWLATWQKSDLIMFRSSIEEFVKYYNKKGKLRRIEVRISRLPIIQKLLDYRKFDLTEL